MAIRDWSGRRLVGTWAAGLVAEGVLILAPIAFFVVIALKQPEFAVAMKHPASIGELPPPPSAPVERFRVDARQRRELSAEIGGAARMQSEISRAVPMPLSREMPEMRAETVGVDRLFGWMTLASVGVYLLTIPVWLTAVTVIWVLTRIGRSPPPASA